MSFYVLLRGKPVAWPGLSRRLLADDDDANWVTPRMSWFKIALKKHFNKSVIARFLSKVKHETFVILLQIRATERECSG